MLIKLLIAIDRSIQLPNTQSVKHRMPKNHENQLVRDSEIFWAHVRFQSCPRPAPTNGHQNTCSIVYSIQSTDKELWTCSVWCNWILFTNTRCTSGHPRSISGPESDPKTPTCNVQFAGQQYVANKHWSKWRQILSSAPKISSLAFISKIKFKIVILHFEVNKNCLEIVPNHKKQVRTCTQFSHVFAINTQPLIVPFQ